MEQRHIIELNTQKMSLLKGKNHINGIENFFALLYSQLQAEGVMQSID